MDLKAPPSWTLLLVVILPCLFGTIGTTSYRIKKVSPVSSSSSSWSSGPIYTIKGSQLTGAGGSQQLRPNTVYTKTYHSNSNGQTGWSSKTVVTHTSHNITTMHHSSGDMIIGTPSKSNIQIYQYVQPTEYYQIIPSHVILSLKIADRVRYNAIFIIGFLLQSPNSRLTLQQYTSLKIIYNALQRRQVQMYRLVPALIQIRGQSKQIQLLTLMHELTKYLPQYYSCSAGFWASQIHNNVFNAEAVLINGHEKFDLFTGITESDIQIIRKFKVDDEMSGYDESSKRTEMLLGRVFVKIFKSMTVNRLNLTQQLFAIVLRNLPNLDGDVVFEEYLQFVSEVAWTDGIPNWEEKQIYQDSIEIYTLIETMTLRIVNDMSVPQVIRKALIYIKNHFVEQRNYVMTAREAFQITGGGGLDITYLLSIISEGEFSYTSIQWKNQLLEFSRNHADVVQTVLNGMNRYGYISKQELLIAFLTRLRTRLSVEYREIRQTVYALLTTVEQKILVWHVTPITSKPTDSITDHPTSAQATTQSTPSGANNETPAGTTQSTPSGNGATPAGTTKSTPSGNNETPAGTTPSTPSGNDATPAGTTQSTPSGNDATPAGTTRSTPSGNDATPAGTTQSTPSGNDATPAGTTQSTPSGNDATPAGTTRSTPSGNDATPGGTTQSTPSGNDATPAGTTRSTPSGNDATPAGTTQSTPSGNDGTPAGTTRSTPSGNNETPAGTTESTPSGNDATPAGTTQSTPSGNNETPAGTTQSTPSGNNETPAGTTQSTPSGNNETPAGTTESTPSGNDATPAGTTQSTPSGNNETPAGTTQSTPSGNNETPAGTTQSTPSGNNETPAGTTQSTPSGNNETPAGTTQSTPSGSNATPSGSTHTPNIGSTSTKPGGTPSPSIGPTATSPGDTTYSTDSKENPTAPTSSPDNTTPNPVEVTPYPEEAIPELPPDINPNESLSIELTETNVPIFSFTVNSNNSKNVLTVPSVTCLQKSPNTHDSRSNCETNTEDYITTHLIEILGNDYIQEVLGYHWEEHYTTKISFLLALLENAEKNPRISSQTELITIIKRYKVALKSVATYVFLPLIIQQQKIDTKIIWSTFDVTNYSTSYVESDRPEHIGTNMITLPLVNPKVWLYQVDINNPFANLLPDLPADNPDVLKLHRLYEIFTSNEIVTLLGKHWNPAVYPNRGALFISVLRTLLTQETVKKDTELYILIQNYLRAIELPSIYTPIPTGYLTRVVKFVVTIPRFPTEISEIKAVIPETVNPETKIQLVVSNVGIPSIESLATVDDKLPLKNLVSLPSVNCLQRASSSSRNSPDNCEQDFDVHITEILIENFGINYIQVILGDNAESLYPTRVSLLVALLEKVQTNPKIVNQFEIVEIIRKYTIALQSVASYVFLPLTVNYRMINSVVVWLSYDINNPSGIDMKALPSYTVSDNIITLPLINPKTWVLSVDVMEPFSGFIPKFSDAESSFAIQLKPLTELIESGKIYELLGSKWRASQFPNRGALYISVMYTLLTIQEVKTNPQLYTLLQHYSTACQLASINVRISDNFFETVIHRWQVDQQRMINRFDPIVANVTARDDILLPALINPKKDLRVVVKTSGRIFVESTRVMETGETDSIILPSVNCLQAFPLEEDDTYCEHFPDLPILHSLIKKLGTKDTDALLEENDNDGYPTMAAYLQNFFKKALEKKKVAEEPKLVTDIKTFMLALEFASSYIFLPLLANYQEIDAELVWLTYDSTDYQQSHMSLHRADDVEDPNIVTLPLVNPKVWLQSVNIEHPFSSFVPNLPANDPYAMKIQPLVQLFNSGEIRLILGSNFSPANYPNRGSLLISTLRLLLESKTVKSNEPLHRLVESYFNVIQVVSMYVHIPRSWINNEFTKGEYTWNVDTTDLSTALPFPQTIEERQYFALIQAFLRTQDILQTFNIGLPSSSTYKAQFLIYIIERVLASSELVQISGEFQAALRYYSAKTELALIANGGVVHWVWVQKTKGTIRSTSTLRLDIGKMFTSTIPLDRLKTNQAKVHYFKLIKFMNDNSSFLKTNDFKYERYPNFGQFLRAYLNHLSRRPDIDKNVKTYIETVSAYIRNTGPGARPIKPKVNKKKH